MNLADIRELETTTIKYFESGHTFMSADSFHHVVENEIRRMKFVEDFDEFRSIIDKRGVVYFDEPHRFCVLQSGSVKE